jgi:hypothetical protein
LSRASRLLGVILCLAGGCLIGFGSAAQTTIKSAVTSVEGVINAVPFLPSVETQLSSFEWFLLAGLVLFVVGAILVAIGGGGRAEIVGPGGRAARKSAEPSCKFCGAPMAGSTIYCPNCGKSQA